MRSREIFILEDDATMRGLLKVILEKAGYQPIFFVDGDALQAEAHRRCPACVLLDVNLPGRSGMDILSELSGRNYPAPILMVSGHGDIPMAVRSLRIGAADVIEKPFRPADLIGRIEQVVASRPTPSTAMRTNPGSWHKLTRREREVLDHLLKGASTKTIARQLDVSPRTVEDHRANIMRKAGVKTTAQLMVVVLGAGDPRQAAA